MALVSITRLRLRSWCYLPMFVWQALRSARQASKAPGNLASKLLRDQRNTFWTATAWTDEASMKKFMLAGAHGAVMRRLPKWCDEASVVHWHQENSTLPTWPEAYQRLLKEGRRSKVNHPTAAHLAFQFPEPRVAPSGETRFK